MTVSIAFRRMAMVTASTKRRPAVSGGLVGSAATEISSLKCTPLDPVDPELRQRIPNVAASQELLQTFVQGGLDIQEGDLLVVGSTEYPIRACGDWYWPHDAADYVALVVEDVK